jgi:hypothetical protein
VHDAELCEVRLTAREQAVRYCCDGASCRGRTAAERRLMLFENPEDPVAYDISLLNCDVHESRLNFRYSRRDDGSVEFGMPTFSLVSSVGAM